MLSWGRIVRHRAGSGVVICRLRRSRAARSLTGERRSCGSHFRRRHSSRARRHRPRRRCVRARRSSSRRAACSGAAAPSTPRRPRRSRSIRPRSCGTASAAGSGGDAYGFLMRTENVEFVDAVRILADRVAHRDHRGGRRCSARPQGAARRRERGGGGLLPRRAHEVARCRRRQGARVPEQARVLEHGRQDVAARLRAGARRARAASDAGGLLGRRDREREPRAVAATRGR